MTRPPPRSTLFPYTTLFRSAREQIAKAATRAPRVGLAQRPRPLGDRKSTRLNSSHVSTSYAVFCLKKKTNADTTPPLPHRSHQRHRHAHEGALSYRPLLGRP